MRQGNKLHGWLEKRAPSKNDKDVKPKMSRRKSLSFMRKKYQRRWFKLTMDSLSYYKDDVEEEKGNPKGVIDIANIMCVQDFDETDRDKLAFTITTQNRIFRLKAYSKMDKDLWVRTLKSRSKYKGEKSSIEDTIQISPISKSQPNLNDSSSSYNVLPSPYQEQYENNMSDLMGLNFDGYQNDERKTSRFVSSDVQKLDYPSIHELCDDDEQENELPSYFQESEDDILQPRRQSLLQMKDSFILKTKAELGKDEEKLKNYVRDNKAVVYAILSTNPIFVKHKEDGKSQSHNLCISDDFLFLRCRRPKDDPDSFREEINVREVHAIVCGEDISGRFKIKREESLRRILCIVTSCKCLMLEITDYTYREDWLHLFRKMVICRWAMDTVSKSEHIHGGIGSDTSPDKESAMQKEHDLIDFDKSIHLGDDPSTSKTSSIRHQVSDSFEPFPTSENMESGTRLIQKQIDEGDSNPGGMNSDGWYGSVIPSPPPEEEMHSYKHSTIFSNNSVTPPPPQRPPPPRKPDLPSKANNFFPRLPSNLDSTKHEENFRSLNSFSSVNDVSNPSRLHESLSGFQDFFAEHIPPPEVETEKNAGWSCAVCTYTNTNMEAPVCEVCQSRRNN